MGKYSDFSQYSAQLALAYFLLNRLHTASETPYQQCTQEGDSFSATSGRILLALKRTSWGLKVVTSSPLPLKTHTSTTMTNHGDDCYSFTIPPALKETAAPSDTVRQLGNETVCNLWQEGRCFRSVCKFRHMEITKNRKEIRCYWENQAAGCQKPHCAFFHESPATSMACVSKNEDQLHEEPAPPPPAPLPTAANPQLRGVIKTEAQEPVPSPTHPPVVINPADDDEDEDDQFSEEGEDGKVGPSPRKLSKSGDSLNFGVSTLEEIRLRKALKASMKRAGYPIQSADSSTNREKENIRSLFQPPLFEARDGPLVFEETVRPRGSVAERLGRKMPNNDVTMGEGVPLKRSLAERLGRVMDEEEPLMPPQKALKPVRERLGLSAGPAALIQSVPTAEASTESKRAPEQIRIKTLEEIKQEKAAKSQLKEGPSVMAPEINNSNIKKGIKRAITIKMTLLATSRRSLRFFMLKKRRQEEQNHSPKKKQSVEKAPGKNQGEYDTAGPGPETTNIAGVRVKTLEEIRREKAARLHAQQAVEAENKKSSDTEENGAQKARLLRIKKPDAQAGSTTTEKSSEGTEKPLKAETSVANGDCVKVKTFEEIMQEKRLRKQEMEEQAKGSPQAESCHKQTAGGTLKRKVPARVSLTPPGSSSPSSTTPAPNITLSTQKVPVLPVKQSFSPPEADPESRSQSPSSSREVPDKNTRNSTALPPAKQTRAAPQGPSVESPTTEKQANNNHKTSPEHTTDTKGSAPSSHCSYFIAQAELLFKLQAAHLRVQCVHYTYLSVIISCLHTPGFLNVTEAQAECEALCHGETGPEEEGAERSAVAAVKPLNSASTVPEEPLQEKTCRDRQVFPSSSAEAQLSSAVPRSPSTLLDLGSSSSPLREDLQTVPVFKQSLNQETKPVSVAAAREACTVPQSPVLKTPTQPKSRRTSVAASRTASTSSAAASTSAVDDFEELINEFTDDHLEDEDVDPGIGEDDLLQELSEMIDS
ncbi:Zinc finger CCCH domain-containing protein 11A [Larimichthys crocea]|uniref:Zinc finger CCCH domain-containing protein 11A n=1 Tax=Larimichthys crocea TaxID=215358 RepID=A0A6G0J2U9_LARCR|nr:Zinc finger CCCH domain-containing protein 11A [Larimichthys crocea]